jgi:hypothetical protein
MQEKIEIEIDAIIAAIIDGEDVQDRLTVLSEAIAARDGHSDAIIFLGPHNVRA